MSAPEHIKVNGQVYRLAKRPMLDLLVKAIARLSKITRDDMAQLQPWTDRNNLIAWWKNVPEETKNALVELYDKVEEAALVKRELQKKLVYALHDLAKKHAAPQK